MSQHQSPTPALRTQGVAESIGALQRTTQHLKKLLIAVVKYGISFTILGLLFYNAWRNKSFDELLNGQKQWGLLTAAFALAITGVALTMVRWYFLVRALGIPFALRDAFRLGFLGYLFNFLSLGVVGGDALKAVFIAREQHGRRTEAVASVVIDRVIGLYALFLLASIAFLGVDLNALNVRDPEYLESIKLVCRVTFTCTVAGGAVALLMMLPGFTTGSFWDMLARIPRMGPTIERLIGAIRMYRRRPGLVVGTILMSLGTHTLFTLGVFLVARGLPGAEPSLATHFVIVPIANVAGAVPLPGGMGAFEFALDKLYSGVATVNIAESQGFVIALGYRIITLLIAVVGVVYYLNSRREVAALMHQAEANDDGEE